MADQIEQMGVTIENHQKVWLKYLILLSFAILIRNCWLILLTYVQQFEELRAQYNAEVLKCSDLSVELDATQVSPALV